MLDSRRAAAHVAVACLKVAVSTILPQKLGKVNGPASILVDFGDLVHGVFISHDCFEFQCCF